MKKILVFLFFIFAINIKLLAEEVDADGLPKDLPKGLPSWYYRSTTAEIDKAFKKRKHSIGGRFMLHSPDMYEGMEILNTQVHKTYGCNGKNISPQFTWKNAPVGTKSFALTIFDRDADTGSGWWNWILYNIPADVDMLNRGANIKKKYMPKGAKQNMNDYGDKEYGGPCPQDGKRHTYIITLYALDVEKLDIPRKATPAFAVLNIRNHQIGSTKITSYYQTPDGKKQEEEERKRRNLRKNQKTTSKLKNKVVKKKVVKKEETTKKGGIINKLIGK